MINLNTVVVYLYSTSPTIIMIDAVSFSYIYPYCQAVHHFQPCKFPFGMYANKV